MFSKIYRCKKQVKFMDSLTRFIVGPIGSGKTYEAQKQACQFVANFGIDEYDNLCHTEHLIEYVQLSPNYDYDNFVSGIEVACENGNILYQNVDRIFSELCEKATNHREQHYCIILDDIDKVNISSILGELINAIEYRNEEITLMNGRTIIVPDNLLIIATMSSISGVVSDYAVLRRFEFIILKSESSKIRDYYFSISTDLVDEIVEKYEMINRFIKEHIAWDKSNKVNDYLIGHTLFFVKSQYNEENIRTLLNKRLKYVVFPILSQFKEDEFIDCTSVELDMLINSTYVSEATSNTTLIPVKKYQENDEGIEYEPIKTVAEIKEHYQSLVAMGNVRGIPALMFEDIFDATYLSNIIDFQKLFVDIYTNTNIVNVSNMRGAISTPPKNSAFLIKRSEKFNFRYNTNGTTCLVYADSATNRMEAKSLYEIFGEEYLIISGFRTADTSCNPNNAYEPTLNAPLSINVLIYKLLVEYYRLVIEMLRDTEENDLLKFAKIELFYLINSSREFKYSSLHSKVLNLTILWSQVGNKVSVDLSKISELYDMSQNGSSVQEFNDVFESKQHLQGVDEIEIIHIGENSMPTSYKTIMDDLNMHQIILQGPPGTSKTYSAKEFIGNRIISQEGLTGVSFTDALATNKLTSGNYSEIQPINKSVVWDIVQFHPSYDYEDFVRGIEVSTTPENQIKYETVNKILGKIAKLANKPENQNKEFYLVIDEINRANVSSVFGELIYALECRDEAVNTPYKIDGDSLLVIPNNLYIIGTMNTADKSIGGIDYAIRRRFAFVDCLPKYDIVRNLAGTDDACECKAFKIIEEIFDNYLNSDYSKDDLQIGHTYFLRKSNGDCVEQMRNRMIYQIIPILREYYKDGVIVDSDSNVSEPVAELFSIIENYSVSTGIDDIINNWLDNYIN